VSQSTDQIESQIEDKRADLKSNLVELESKVKAIGDWRQQFQKHPGAMMAAAFGGGLLLANIAAPRRRAVEVAAGDSSRAALAASSKIKPEVNQAWENIKAALIGVAASKVKDVLSDAIPGFRQQIAETDRDKSARAEAESRTH